MPGGNRTGPMGQGPMTGRGAGFCTGYQVPGYANRAAPGCGRGRCGGGGRFGGRAEGRGFSRSRNGFAPNGGIFGYTAAASGSASNEKDLLKERQEFLERELQIVQDAIKSLDEDATSE